ncbi:MAG TPA: flagellar hook capping FlgD N-terminal domain-containing protein [Terracidiphilus sp.]|jgi:flagellar basal-body rod modification protein FlgD|nr:flagellar hook capping FlgD N-terminal domain-containing protein [Terracidiphilus sp.]
MAVSAIWNQGMAGANPLTQAKPMSSEQDSSAASSNGASVSANDFLTLLVTEMKNQDPTANTDPNQYINQLVQVNSLEQLISINQNLSTALGTSATGSGQASNPEPVEDSHGKGNYGATAAARISRGIDGARTTHDAQGGSSPATAANGIPREVTSGNLSIPRTTAASERVAHALGGRHQAPKL